MWESRIATSSLLQSKKHLKICSEYMENIFQFSSTMFYVFKNFLNNLYLLIPPIHEKCNFVFDPLLKKVWKKLITHLKSKYMIWIRRKNTVIFLYMCFFYFVPRNRMAYTSSYRFPDDFFSQADSVLFKNMDFFKWLDF